MLHRWLLGREIRENPLGKNLAKLNAPLIIAVDVPDDALHENLVLVECHKRTESFGGELLAEKRIRRLVALESLERNELLFHTLLLALFSRLAKRKSLGLRKEISHELVVKITNRIVRHGAANEVARDEVSPLVDELIERVLAVRARLAPLDGSCRVGDGLAVLVYALAVGLHIHLLEIRGEARKILVIRKNRVALRAIAVVIEDAEKRENDRHIALKARSPEVAIHLVVALEKLLVIVAANRDHKRKTDCGRKRIAPADPIPEAEHILDINTKLGNLVRRSRKRHKVLRYSLLRAKLLNEPILGGLGVGHGLLSRKRLGRHNEERLLGLDFAEHLG